MLTGPEVLQCQCFILEPSVFIPREGHSRTFQLEGIIFLDLEIPVVFFSAWKLLQNAVFQPLASIFGGSIPHIKNTSSGTQKRVRPPASVPFPSAAQSAFGAQQPGKWKTWWILKSWTGFVGK